MANSPRGHKSPPRSRTKASKASKAEERRHKAIEQVIQKAQQEAKKRNIPPSGVEPSSQLPPNSLPAGQPSAIQGHSGASLSPDVLALRGSSLSMDAALLFAPISTQQPIPSQTVTAEVHDGPLASVTPTASGMQPSTQPESQVFLVVAALILEAICQGIAQGLQQRAFSQVSSYVDRLSRSQGSRDLEESTADQDRAHSPGSASQASQSKEGEIPLNQELSDDDGLESDQSSFVGLFRLQLFRSLLYDNCI